MRLARWQQYIIWTNINFNQNELINNKNEPYVVVHQYDKRWEVFEDSVKKLKMELGIS